MMRTALICTLAFAAVLAIALIPGGSGDAAFPGENGQMVFSRFTPTSDAQLFTRQATGAFAEPLTQPPVGQDDFNPSWSADGTMVAFERFDVGGPELRIVRSDGTDDILVPGGDGGRRPSWAPDGKQLVFERDGDLFTINLDGGGLTNITEAFDTPAFEADWSPDGEKIVFKTDIGEREPLYVMNADGSDPVRLENLDGAFEDGNPDWSPDGTRIAFDFFRASTEEVDIIVVNSDGTDRVNLTDDIAPDAHHPAWSPDGTKILFENHSSLNRRGRVSQSGFSPVQMFEMNADGSGKRNITQDGLVAEVDPDWGSALPQPTPTQIPGQNVVWGDNRCDGELDTTDGLAVLRHVAALSALTQTQPCPPLEHAIHALQPGLWGDVDCDQDVDTVDDLKVLRVIAGFKVEQPQNCYPIGLEGAVIQYEAP